MAAPKLVDVGAAAEDVTVNGPGNFVVVTNVSGGGYVAFRCDGTAASLADGAAVYGVPAGARVVVPIHTADTRTISMIASAASVFCSVCAVSRPEVDG